jgi:DNA-binding transcriptional MocR family regulator
VVPGKFFYPYDNMGLETMRLNYTISDIPMIEKAIKIVANVIKEMLK